MTKIIFTAMAADEADAFRNGRPDANGQVPERHHATGTLPCRVCLGHIKEGETALLLAYRPFPTLQPFAETGPIFIHAESCSPDESQGMLPAMLDSPDYIIRGYSHDNRIVYGTGAVTPADMIAQRAEDLLARDDIAYVHVRSARNNCYQCRIDRA